MIFNGLLSLRTIDNFDLISLAHICAHVCRYLCVSCGYAGTSAYVSTRTCNQRWILRGVFQNFFFFYFLGQTILLNLQQTKSGYPCLNLLSNRIMIMTTFYLFLFFIFFHLLFLSWVLKIKYRSSYLSGKLFANGAMPLAHDFIFEE